MKQIDHFDSTQQFNFSEATAKAKREKFGSFLLAIVGILGLLAISTAGLQQSTHDAINKGKTSKFWLTPSSLNAEQTAFNTPSIPSSETGTQLIVAAEIAGSKRVN